MSKISIVFGYKNRDILRVRRCLNSLKDQTVDDFEVILIDYGSDEDYSDKMEGLCSEYSFVTYIFNNTRGMPWNRSHALNTGVKTAIGEYILFGDIDLIYSINFINSFYKKLTPETQFYKPVYWLPKKINDWSRLVENKNIYTNSSLAGKGGVHIIKKDILFTINGFDEFYCFWGVEDRDLNTRIEKLGVNTEWLPLETASVYHQWHPIVSNTKKGFFPDKWWDSMNIHYAMNIHKTKRNENGWGNILKTEDRTSIINLKKNNFKEIIKIPKEGDSYTKAQTITKIINEFSQIISGDSILIEAPKYNFYVRDTLVVRGLKKIISKIALDYILVNRTEQNRLENSQDYFNSQNDIVYLIWNLIKQHSFIRDYYFNESSESIQLIISK